MKKISRAILSMAPGAVLFASSLALSVASSGCVAGISSSMSGIQNATGEAWYTETKGFGMLAMSTKVFYCPAPTTNGPAQCLEAKMIPTAEAPPPAKQSAPKKSAGSTPPENDEPR